MGTQYGYTPHLTTSPKGASYAGLQVSSQCRRFDSVPGTTNTEKPQAKLTSLGFLLPAICASGALRSSPAFRNGLDGIHTDASSQHRWHPVIFPKPIAG